MECSRREDFLGTNEHAVDIVRGPPQRNRGRGRGVEFVLCAPKLSSRTGPGSARVIPDSFNPLPQTPTNPIRISVIGAGHHSRTFHLPALAHYHRLHPEVVLLDAIVDPNVAVSTAAAAAFGFKCAFSSVEEMLAKSRPHACLALTPVALNACVAMQLVRNGLPVLMEKPPGATLIEARRLVSDVAALGARVMVSMNRRFDPLLRAALAWIGPRAIQEVRATMARKGRTEPEFVEHTGLHVVDIVRVIGGDVISCAPRRQNAGSGDWFQVGLTFASGATGVIDLMPTAGRRAELLEISGDGFKVEIQNAEFGRGGWRAWSGDRLERDETLPSSTPMFIANGTFAETEAFLDGVVAGERLYPTPADVLPSMELCRAIEEAELTQGNFTPSSP